MPKILKGVDGIENKYLCIKTELVINNYDNFEGEYAVWVTLENHDSVLVPTGNRVPIAGQFITLTYKFNNSINQPTTKTIINKLNKFIS